MAASIAEFGLLGSSLTIDSNTDMSQFDSFDKAMLSLRQPATTFSPSDRDFSQWGIPTSPNTPVVTENSALSLSAFFGGLSLIAECFSSIKCNVYKKLKGGGREIADQHPAQWCLTKTNNGWMIPSVFKSQGMGCLILSGNHVGEIIRNARGQCVEITPWMPRNTSFGLIDNKEPCYGVSATGVGDSDIPIIFDRSRIKASIGSIEWFPYTECIHVKGFSTDGYVGKAILALARASLALGLTIEQFEQRFFDAGRTQGFLSTPNFMSDPDRKKIRNEWNEMQAGARNAYNIGILSGGMDWKAMGFNNEQAQLLQSKALQVYEVCRWLRIPPHMLAELSKATETNIEQLMLQFITFCIQPWCNKWKEELDIKLFTPMERHSYEVDFDIDGFLRGDRLNTEKVREMRLRNGLRTLDEERVKDNLAPYPEGIGAKPLIIASQLNYLEDLPKLTDAQVAKGQPKPAASSTSTSDS